MHTLIRLQLRQKFAILAALGFLLTAIVLVLSVRESRQHAAAAAHEARGLVPVRAVLSLVTLLQQHRGLSSAYLGGDAGIANRHLEIEHEINIAFANTNVDIAMIENEAVNRIWSGVHRNWAAMPRALLLRSVSAQQSFEQHTAMIDALFKIIDMIVDSHGLGRDQKAGVALLSQATLAQAPQLAETLDRMRELGTSLLNAGTASEQQRDALAGMQKRAAGLHDAIEQAVGRAGDAQPALRGRFAAPLAHALETDRAALRLTQDKIVGAERFAYPAVDYGAAMSKAIDAQRALHDAAAGELARLLDVRQAELRRTQPTTVAALALLALLAAAFVWLMRPAAPRSDANTPAPAIPHKTFSREPAATPTPAGYQAGYAA